MGITEETAKRFNELMKRTIEFHHSIKYNKTSKDMNENIDLTKILKDCPKGYELYCSVCGYVTFKIENNHSNPIAIYSQYSDFEKPSLIFCLSKRGKYSERLDGECILFPSKDQRDWSKFTTYWYKKEKFDPKTLKPFDRVLCKNGNDLWKAELFSHYDCRREYYPFRCGSNGYSYCIPYNDETKHLVGTTEEAPDFYHYWED